MINNENDRLAEAVVQFAQGGRIFETVKVEADRPWLVTDNLLAAKQFAWEIAVGEEELLWRDIRELAMADVKEVLYNQPNLVARKEKLLEDVHSMMPNIRKRLDSEHADLVDDICSDLYCIALNRLLNGTKGFFEEMFKAYEAGGWPCGWSGNYPSGQLRVYLPTGKSRNR